MSADDDARVGDGLPIQEASRLLGVPAPTLRSWERRHGIPTTPRSPGGHRRYSTAALEEVRLMRDEVARGLKASAAARAVRALLDRDDPAQVWVGRMLAASAALDPTAVRAVLDEAVAELGLPAALDSVLMPGMRRVGNLWESGRCDVGQEHLTTEAVRGWLARITTLAPAPTVPGTALLACGPRDLHTLGLEALAALLAHRGIGCRVLGARTPQRTLVTALAATEAAAVVVVSHLPTHRRQAVESLAAVAGKGVPLFYAGNGFASLDSRAGVPGTWLGESLAEAADQVAAAVLPPA
ncbi:B12-binding domain-containing protein [Nocardioides sp. cx-169]|uniref:B12-binding domain-containing protein n=1 Tax=Nocardioides sp. cx-169 TaxID=2899080 RepID=UPI001E28626B|nr:B12-binding domain-containing protein [Nocardioides sp. cx-169]MCD4536582.1 B12-binding domain-containing protein [Nocardioides sp. cx-169]